MAGCRRLDCIVAVCDDEERLEELWAIGAGKGDFEANMAIVRNTSYA